MTVRAQSVKSNHKIKHFAIIPDGNRRWARQKGLPPYEGHRQAIKTLQTILPIFKEYNIPYVTIWAFSTENWKRPKNEIHVLFQLLQQLTTTLKSKINENKIKIRIIGRRDRFPTNVLNAINALERTTAKNTGYTLVIPLDYGGQDEIRRAFVKLLTKIKIKELSIDLAIHKLLETQTAIPTINNLMDMPELPYPDIILRTSGEMRLSGFYSWQNAYAELFFLKKYFPDLTPKDIERIIYEFSTKRQRRFGGDNPKTI